MRHVTHVTAPPVLQLFFVLLALCCVFRKGRPGCLGSPLMVDPLPSPQEFARCRCVVSSLFSPGSCFGVRCVKRAGTWRASPFVALFIGSRMEAQRGGGGGRDDDDLSRLGVQTDEFRGVM
ncbi:hypothetical protein Taro_027344 [Colocasia esculenta]|uniref:Secreted protein n=1 Tax=Colocasia esculenta TaxID=4460 RepID=A0A843VDN6_COLES|nr:hypothetical protein [Colocasia esculenta]